MASVQEITPEQLSGIDTNEVASMTLKDGTLIVINGGEEVQAQEEEFVQEPQEEVQNEEVAEEQTQENQLRARPLDQS